MGDMKTMIFCTSSMDTKYDWIFKYKLWFDYLYTISRTGTDLYMINDGGISDELIDNIEMRWSNSFQHFSVISDYTVTSHVGCMQNIITHPNKLGKLHYRGWSRSFFSSLDIAEKRGYDKIIHIESDAFVLSDRLWKYLYDIKEGWEVLWCPRYNMPENAIQVICKDSFPEFRQQADRFKDGIRQGIIENLLPYKKINKDFVGDRYGEIGLPFSNKMDYYCQYGDILKQRG